MAVSVIKASAHMETGYFTISGVTTTEESIHVNFTKSFASNPAVIASISGSSYNRRLHVSNITPTGFDIVGALLNGSTSATIYGYWLATELGVVN